MKHIFLDSSVILSFCRSKKGASAFILDNIRQGNLKGYISKKVIFEVTNNNKKDKNELGERRFSAFFDLNILTVVTDASENELKRAHEAFNNPKDEPIIAAAKQTQNIQYILSLDNGFFTEEVKTYIYPREVLKPGEFLNKFREELQ